MFTLSCLWFLLTVSYAVGVTTIENDFDTYIVGGAEAEAGQFPYLGAVINPDGIPVCGCVLVSSVWAVSAAHCPGNIESTTEWGSLVIGEGTVINILEISRNPEYGQGPGFSPNDISVIRLEEPADALENVTPIPIGRQRIEGGFGLLAGWGRTCGNCTFSESLQFAEVDVLSDGQCTALWADSYYGPAHLCVFEPQNRTIASCNGDGGGPFVTEIDGQQELHGIVSWGAVGCLPELPSVNTRVSQYASWVCAETENEALGCVV